MAETPKPMQGTWTLTAPDGRTWHGESPLRCASAEQAERVPATVQLQRILAAVDETREEEIQDMVNRFLGWKLPPTFSPDAGVKFAPSNGMSRKEAYGKAGWWPIGTNLLTADEARQMVEHMLGVKRNTYFAEQATTHLSICSSQDDTMPNYPRCDCGTDGVGGIDGPRHGPWADGSQTPNDAAAIPCAKAGSSTSDAGVAGTSPGTFGAQSPMDSSNTEG